MRSAGLDVPLLSVRSGEWVGNDNDAELAVLHAASPDERRLALGFLRRPSRVAGVGQDLAPVAKGVAEEAPSLPGRLRGRLGQAASGHEERQQGEGRDPPQGWALVRDRGRVTGKGPEARIRSRCCQR